MSQNLSRAIRVVRLPSGETSIEVNVLGLPQPSEFFHADWYQCQPGRRFLFGKLSVGAAKLVRVIEVVLNRRALQTLRASLEVRDFKGTLEVFVRGDGPYEKPAELSPANLVDSGTKEFSFVASIAFMGFSENDASCSFFRIPPGAELVANLDPAKIVVEPIVRIDTSSAILFAFASDVVRETEESHENG